MSKIIKNEVIAVKIDEETINSLLKSEDDIENSRTRNGTEVVKELREKYKF